MSKPISRGTLKEERSTRNIVNNYQRLTGSLDKIIVSQPFFINCYAVYDKLLARLLNRKKYRSLLDVGCGSGVQTVVLAAHTLPLFVE